MLEAARSGDADAIVALLSKGAGSNETNAADGAGWTPLHWAASGGHDGVVAALLGAEANVNAATYTGWTPLYLAAAYGHVGVVAALLCAGANLNATNDIGWTPLHGAANNGHVNVVAALLGVRANASAADIYGRTPLHWAAIRGHVSVVEALVEAGASICCITLGKSEYNPRLRFMARMYARWDAPDSLRRAWITAVVAAGNKTPSTVG